VLLEGAAVLDHFPGDATAAQTALVDAVARAGQADPALQWVLVIDDHHALTAPEVHEAMSLLLDQAAGMRAVAEQLLARAEARNETPALQQSPRTGTASSTSRPAPAVRKLHEHGLI
jgi:hypothetical protein